MKYRVVLLQENAVIVHEYAEREVDALKTVHNLEIEPSPVFGNSWNVDDRLIAFVAFGL